MFREGRRHASKSRVREALRRVQLSPFSQKGQGTEISDNGRLEENCNGRTILNGRKNSHLEMNYCFFDSINVLNQIGVSSILDSTVLIHVFSSFFFLATLGAGIS